MKLGIVDHGLGNLFSVTSAFEYIGANPELCAGPAALRGVDRIVLPGVGAFGDCVRHLEDRGFLPALNELVLGKKIPTLGICLGMQVMAQRSAEAPGMSGLGWVKGEAVRLDPGPGHVRVPHMGWNDVQYCRDSPLFRDLPEKPDFYFVHSYRVDCADEADVDAICDCGYTVTAAVRKANIFATQFHPEKSQDVGLTVLANFLSWDPQS